eukprot:TRINITY_DN15211_c0_g1_i1.p1 TRINITY_DN15211_c0_g1~~TRINITY_DN15211_c0_g1_i1.p1  ORF type:complete len:227 (-),score=34.33 TRINITY_DN15211_c0_g1_i1:182-862(-)
MDIIKSQEQFDKQYDIKELHAGNQIGRGSFGDVFQIKNKLNDQKFALKRIECQQNELLENIEKEIIIQFNLPQHPNIIKHYQVFKIEQEWCTSFYLELELAETSLQKILTQSKQKLTEEQLISYILQTLDGCVFLKANNVYHRDIKPDNLLLIQNQIKLVDFGESKQFVEQQKIESGYTVVGTPQYLSPILFDSFKNSMQSCKHDPEKSDVYAMGITYLYLSLIHI